MRTSRFLQVITATVLAAANAQAQTGREQAGQLPAFRSDAELTAFMRDLSKRWERQYASQREAEGCEQEKGYLRSRKRTAGRGGAAVIHGRIANTSGLAIAQAQVLLATTAVGSSSARDGTYRLDIAAASLPKGRKLTLRALLIGFRSQSFQLSLSPGDSVVVDFVLCPEAVKFVPIVISSYAGSQEITKVQHGDVDEGGIVKLHGDHLVILRRGRLFTVHIGDGALEVASVVNAFAPGSDPDGTWYAELLVSGDKFVVVGLSYARGETELGLFRIGARGELSHRATYHLRSDDSRFFPSRLVGNRLVLYTPLPLSLVETPVSAGTRHEHPHNQVVRPARRSM